MKLTKRMLAALLVLCMLVSMAACGAPQETQPSGSNAVQKPVREQEGVWSFHRYYLAVKSAVLVPWAQCADGMGVAVNYRTMLRCSRFVAGYVTSYGAKLTGDATVYADAMADGSTLDTENSFLTRLDGILKTTNTPQQNRENAHRTAAVCAYLRLADGTQLESAVVETSAAQLIAEADRLELTLLQKQALAKLHSVFDEILSEA